MVDSLISGDSSYLGRTHMFCLRCDIISSKGNDLFDSLMHTSCRPSNSHGLTVRLTVWDAISRSYGFASKSYGEPENLEIDKKFHKV